MTPNGLEGTNAGVFVTQQGVHLPRVSSFMIIIHSCFHFSFFVLLAVDLISPQLYTHVASTLALFIISGGRIIDDKQIFFCFMTPLLPR